jgi:hypothetical protein
MVPRKIDQVGQMDDQDPLIMSIRVEENSITFGDLMRDNLSKVSILGFRYQFHKGNVNVSHKLDLHFTVV